MEAREYYEREPERNTGQPQTDGLIITENGKTLERRKGDWVGPIEADLQELEDAASRGIIEYSGDVAQDQIERVKEIAEPK